MTQHNQSIGGQGAEDGIAGSRSGTEGATSGAGVDKGAQQKDQREQRDQGHAHAGHGHGGQHSGGMGGERGGPLHDVGSAQSGMTGRGGMGGNSSANRQSTGPGVMETEPRENQQQREPIPKAEK
jgi:hypothetical protein